MWSAPEIQQVGKYNHIIFLSTKKKLLTLPQATFLMTPSLFLFVCTTVNILNQPARPVTLIMRIKRFQAVFISLPQKIPENDVFPVF